MNKYVFTEEEIEKTDRVILSIERMQKMRKQLDIAVSCLKHIAENGNDIWDKTVCAFTLKELEDIKNDKPTEIE